MTESMMRLALNNGVEMPALGLGVFQTRPDETRAAVEAALATGYRHVDTAAAYGNEREVGDAVRASGLGRDEVFSRRPELIRTVVERPPTLTSRRPR